jgi:hypothetical protein
MLQSDFLLYFNNCRTNISKRTCQIFAFETIEGFTVYENAFYVVVQHFKVIHIFHHAPCNSIKPKRVPLPKWNVHDLLTRTTFDGMTLLILDGVVQWKIIQLVWIDIYHHYFRNTNEWYLQPSISDKIRWEWIMKSYSANWKRACMHFAGGWLSYKAVVYG